MTQRFSGTARAIILGAALLGLGACASASKPEMMAVSVAPVPAASKGYQAMRVGAVTGGGETNPLWVSNVSSDDFKTALETSLANAALANPDPGKANLEVTANIIKLDQPLAGLDLSVTSRVRYTVKPAGGGDAVFDDTVAATGTAKFADALVAVERLRLANEASIRANIESFITQLKKTLGAN